MRRREVVGTRARHGDGWLGRRIRAPCRLGLERDVGGAVMQGRGRGMDNRCGVRAPARAPSSTRRQENSTSDKQSDDCDGSNDEDWTATASRRGPQVFVGLCLSLLCGAPRFLGLRCVVGCFVELDRTDLASNRLFGSGAWRSAWRCCCGFGRMLLRGCRWGGRRRGSSGRRLRLQTFHQLFHALRDACRARRRHRARWVGWSGRNAGRWLGGGRGSS